MQQTVAVTVLLLVAVSAAGCSADEPTDAAVAADGLGEAPVAADGPADAGNSCATPAADPAKVDCDPFSDVAVFPGDYDTTGPRSRTLETGTFPSLDPEVVHLESEVDGVDIEIGFVRPDAGDERVPVIALAGAYHPVLTPENFNTNPLGAWVNPLAGWLIENFVPHGYAVALIAARGSGGSGGCFDYFGRVEAADLSQGVSWLGNQSWSNGNVGMIGLSAEGTPPWEVAGLGNPHLKTIVPMSGWTDIRLNHFANGTVHNAGAARWAIVYGTVSGAVVQRVDPNGIVCPDQVEAASASLQGTAMGSEQTVEYWRERNHREGVAANYTGTILVVHGLQDSRVVASHVYPWVQDLEARGLVVKHVVGQWDHGTPDRRAYALDDPRYDRHDWAEQVLHWFDRWLKEDTTVDIGVAAQVQDNLFQWRIETTWPPQDTTPVGFHLAADGSLTQEATTPVGSRTLVLDPNSADRMMSEPEICGGLSLHSSCNESESFAELPCPRCPEFATATMDSELRFAGLPRVHLKVTPSGPGGQVAGHLYLETAAGERDLVGRGSMDLRYAAGGWESAPVTPGVSLVARMQLQPLDVVVPAGSRLVLVVSQGNHAEHVVPTMPAPIELHVGGAASTMTIDSFDGSTRTFFETP